MRGERKKKANEEGRGTDDAENGKIKADVKLKKNQKNMKNIRQSFKSVNIGEFKSFENKIGAGTLG